MCSIVSPAHNILAIVNFSRSALEDIGRDRRNGRSTSSCYMDKVQYFLDGRKYSTLYENLNALGFKLFSCEVCFMYARLSMVQILKNNIELNTTFFVVVLRSTSTNLIYRQVLFQYESLKCVQPFSMILYNEKFFWILFLCVLVNDEETARPLRLIFTKQF